MHEYSRQVDIDRIVVKFRDEFKVREEAGGLVSSKCDLSSLSASIAAVCGQSLSPVFLRDQSEIDRERARLESEKSIKLPDLNSYYQLRVQDYDTAMQLLEFLSQSPLVEKAYIRPRSYPAGDIPPPTPDFSMQQGYLYSAPEGVDAEYAWGVPGGQGENVHIIDIEGNWNFDHEDFGENIDTLLYGLPVNLPGWASHGTCVVGILAADSNDYGITGIAPQATVSTISVGGLGTAFSVDLAASVLNPGDIILIELNSPGPRYNFEYQPDQAGYVPEEYFDETFDAVQMASAKGIIVCAVAGNGNEDLDDPIYENKFNVSFRNSRAIIIGAGAPPSGNWGPDRSRLYFSNYGSRVNLQGWGKEVVASGYGVLFDGEGDYRQHYTDMFNGTSSAAAMVTGAVACTQSAYIEAYGQPMTAEALAYLLDLSGTLQPNPAEHIGPRPDLYLALLSFQPPANVHTDPGYVEYSLTDGQTGATNVLLLNDNSDIPVDYSINIDDTIEGWEIGGWLDVNPKSGTIDPGSGTILNLYFDGTIIPGSTLLYKANVVIQLDLNPGTDSLLVPVFFDLKCNDTSYSTYDSDYGQISYEWKDITQTGTAIPNSAYYNQDEPSGVLDDGTAGPFPIGFWFNLYNQYFNSFYVSTNGAISFTDSNLTVNGYYSSQFSFPEPGFNTFISPFWNDLSLDTSANGHGTTYYYTSDTADSLIVSFEKIGNFVPTGDTLITFQIILTKDGHIRYQYKETGMAGAETTALVGFALDQGCSFVKYFDRYQSIANMPHDFLAVEFQPGFEFEYIIGDTNNDGAVNVSDPVWIINYVFMGGDPPIPYQAGDANCDVTVNVSDAVWLINYIFLSGNLPGDLDGDGIVDC